MPLSRKCTVHRERTFKRHASLLKGRQLARRNSTSSFERHSEVAALACGANVGSITGIEDCRKISVDHSSQRRSELCVRPNIDKACHAAVPPNSEGQSPNRSSKKQAMSHVSCTTVPPGMLGASFWVSPLAKVHPFTYSRKFK
jgi:hypothetical protein